MKQLLLSEITEPGTYFFRAYDCQKKTWYECNNATIIIKNENSQLLVKEDKSWYLLKNWHHNAVEDTEFVFFGPILLEPDVRFKKLFDEEYLIRGVIE